MRLMCGKWTKHIHLEEMRRWYDLPSEIEEELKHYQFNEFDDIALPPPIFDRLMQQIREYTDASVGHWTLAAHHPGHFETVRHNALALFDAYYGERAFKNYLFVRQALEIAAYMHDLGHPGSSLRIDHLMPLHLPELGNRVSVEYVTAIMVNRYLKELGLPLPWRVFIIGVIWATTFGHGPAKERGLGFIPDVKPKTLYHALIRVADSQPQVDFTELVDYGARVHWGEMPPKGVQLETVDEFVPAQRGYLWYVDISQMTLDEIAEKPICDLTGFREITRSHYETYRHISPELYQWMAELKEYYYTHFYLPWR